MINNTKDEIVKNREIDNLYDSIHNYLHDIVNSAIVINCVINRANRKKISLTDDNIILIHEKAGSVEKKGHEIFKILANFQKDI